MWQNGILQRMTDFCGVCYILQQRCIIMRFLQPVAIGLFPEYCSLISLHRVYFSRVLLRTSVLAYPWWYRVLLVVPVCLLLWLGVCWALGGD